MKSTVSILLRAIGAIVVGALLIKYSEQAVTWLTIIIGAIFLVSGLASCATYLASRRNQNADVQVFDAQGNLITPPSPSFPLVGIGSVILGALLALAPNIFINGLMYVLAAILILGALNQFVSLGATTRIAHIGCFWWVFPSIILLIGLIAIFKPSLIASAPLYVIGWCMMVYGVVELVNDLKIYQCRKVFEKAQKKAAESMAQESEANGVQDSITTETQQNSDDSQESDSNHQINNSTQKTN
ncbi:MAG: DUF308 domain-containing protein [Prevotella sp.]|jgi:hypothetical protein